MRLFIVLSDFFVKERRKKIAPFVAFHFQKEENAVRVCALQCVKIGNILLRAFLYGVTHLLNTRITKFKVKANIFPFRNFRTKFWALVFYISKNCSSVLVNESMRECF